MKIAQITLSVTVGNGMESELARLGKLRSMLHVMMLERCAIPRPKTSFRVYQFEVAVEVSLTSLWVLPFQRNVVHHEVLVLSIYRCHCIHSHR